jgi:3'-phosphoadenosine 5'-phosphosulfate sulfotransferase (PAPS reductase)/FAD synthetase
MQQELFPTGKGRKLTILSYGGGQDSTAILYKLIHDPVFRLEYAPDDLVVVMADTFNEHKETYAYVKKVQDVCKEHNIPFILLRHWATGDWENGLINFYEAKSTVGSKAFRKTCTMRLKINPIYNWLDAYLHEHFGTTVSGSKKAIRQFALNHGKIDVLIGIAREEEKRAGTNEESKDRWMRESINKRYPLIDIGYNRQDCQDYISGLGYEVPMPSNCILCPFMSKQELLYLYRKMPEWYNKWVDLEENKIRKFMHNGDRTKTLKGNGDIGDNLGVWGKKLLPEILQEAIQEFGHMTDEELHEYKMSHGHCVKSKY